MTILAIDPGKRTGWAALTDGTLEASGVCDGDDIELVDSIFSEHLPDVLVVEDQYLRGRVRGIKTLLRRRFTWEILARLRRIEVVEVNPMRWQGYYHIRRGDKKAIGVMAGGLTGRKCQADEADAVCMAYWCETTRGG